MEEEKQRQTGSTRIKSLIILQESRRSICVPTPHNLAAIQKEKEKKATNACQY